MQAAAAKALFARESVWIGKTVLIETAWVFRSLYGLNDVAVHDALTKLLGLENVTVEDEPAVSAALSLNRQDVEFADAMHVSSRPPGCAFITFDKSFATHATRAGAANVMSLSGPPRRSNR
ncbi:MAG: PIN domain-containing protein [Ignavibacteriota bacterium]